MSRGSEEDRIEEDRMLDETYGEAWESPGRRIDSEVFSNGGRFRIRTRARIGRYKGNDGAPILDQRLVDSNGRRLQDDEPLIQARGRDGHWRRVRPVSER